MDITLARTFLAIRDLGNFLKASDRLFITQSAVSSRVRLLEDLLGQTLFVVAVSYGPLVLQQMSLNGGSAYLPMRLVQPRLEDGSLHLVDGLPSFGRPIYTVHFGEEESERFKTAIQGLRYIAMTEVEQQGKVASEP